MEPTDSNRWSVIFGELKAKARSDFSRWLWRDDSETMDCSISVEILEKYWISILEAHVQRAWNVV
jgi:hypothetical protein